jgi:hypothetical protein
MKLFEIYVHHCFDETPGVLRRIEAIERKVSAMHEEFQAAIVRIETATTAVGARLDALAAKLANGVTAEEAAPLIAELTALGDKLEAMGKDPVNPDPVPLPPTE